MHIVVPSKYGGAGDRSAENMVVQGTGEAKKQQYGGAGDRSEPKI